MIKKMICAILLVFIYFQAPAQESFNEFRARVNKEFNDFKRQAQDDFEAYRAKVNADFAEFMRNAWKPVKGSPAIPKPDPIPDIPPVVVPDKDIPDIPDNNEIPFDNIVPINPEPEPTPQPLIPIPDEPGPIMPEKMFLVSFYGTDCPVSFDLSSTKYKMRSANENAAADMWNEMQKEEYIRLVSSCLKVKKDLTLCDWAYFKFTNMVSKQIFGNSNEAVMLNAFILNQSGYKLRLGRSNNNILHLLVSVSDDLYGYVYFTLDGTHYYLTDDSQENSMYILDCQFPNEKSLRMNITTENHFALDASEPILLQSKRYPDVSASISVNKNLMRFYCDYPHSYKRNDQYSHWSFYANTPISDKVKKTLYPKLIKAISGKTQCEAANILINFVQTAFEYMKDEDFWGYERSFFPDETLYYPYSDCEDRAILYSRLVRDLLGLKVVLLYYPRHLATAVEFTEHVSGDYLNVEGHKYIVCDATYINMPLGHTMPDMDNSKAVVVMLE